MPAWTASLLVAGLALLAFLLGRRWSDTGDPVARGMQIGGLVSFVALAAAAIVQFVQDVIL